MSIASELKRWASSPEGIAALNKAAVGRDGDVGALWGRRFERFAARAANRMYALLRKEILPITNQYGEKFLDHIVVDGPYVRNGEIEFDISFDEFMVTRPSVDRRRYPEGVYLPYIFNNNYDTGGKRLWGADRHGTFLQTAPTLPVRHLHTVGFIQRAVDKFNAEYSGRGARAQYSYSYNA